MRIRKDAHGAGDKIFPWIFDDLRLLLAPRFLFPSVAILVFSLAALNLTVRFLGEEKSALNETLERGVSLLESEDAFHEYKEFSTFYIAGINNIPFSDVQAAFKKFQKKMEGFSRAEESRKNIPEARTALLSLQDDIVYLDYLFQSEGKDRRDPDYVREIESKNKAIAECFETLVKIILGGGGNGALSREVVNSRHNQILWSVFVMGLSGFVLIVFLVDRLARLERVDGERRQALVLAEQRVASMEAALDGLMITGPEGGVSYANRAVLQNYRYEGDASPVGQRWSGLYTREQIDIFKAVIVPEVEEKGVWAGRVHALRHDGTVFPQDLSITRLEDGGAIWVMRDVAEKMEAEKLSRRRLAAIEAAGDGIGIAGSDGKLTYMNRALMALYGISAEDREIYLGESWEFLYSGRGGWRIDDTVRTALSESGYWQGETRIVRRDGSQVWAEMTLTILPDGGVVCTARDITERKQADAEKEGLREQFFQAQKMEAIGRLAGGIAHDFNNILAAIMGYAEFLAEDLQNDPPRKQFAEGVLQAGAQGRHLVDQMLSFSRRQETARNILDITGAVRETVSILRASLPRTIEVEEHFEMERALVDANATQIAQAVMNLCVNARDAMEDGHGVLSIGLSYIDASEDLYEDMLVNALPGRDAAPPIRLHEVEPGHACLELGVLARGRRYVLLSVSDTGTGMSYDVMQHIFEPFFTTKAVDKGTGLGLANVHGVVVAHQGALVVDSVLGEGTRFDLFFPVAEGEDGGLSSSPVQEKEAGKAVETKKANRILVVEDQAQVRDMMVVMLTRMGYHVHTCNSGIEALYHLRENRMAYDLVITDYNMPRMTGIELADQSVIEMPGLPFILVTGYSQESLSGDMGTHRAIQAVLRKPVDRQALAREIDKALAGKQDCADVA